MKVYFNDNSYGAGPLALGVPDQKAPAFLPYNTAPDLKSYHRYT